MRNKLEMALKLLYKELNLIKKISNTNQDKLKNKIKLKKYQQKRTNKKCSDGKNKMMKKVQDLELLL